jgi:uncharacterized membrane protein
MKLNQRFPPEILQVLTHFYRAEVQRSTDWRTRLDTTTNWAVITMTAGFSWALANVQERHGGHIILFFTNWVIFLLLGIEARRYRHFDVWRTRVRMLEVHFLVPALNPEVDIVQGDWREVLSNDLLMPSFKISFREALAKRLWANYLWIFSGVQLGWLLCVYTAAVLEAEAARGPGGHGIRVSWWDLYQACGFGWGERAVASETPVVPPWLVILGYLLLWTILIGISVTTWKDRHVTGEIRRRDRKAKKWPI